MCFCFLLTLCKDLSILMILIIEKLERINHTHKKKKKTPVSVEVSAGALSSAAPSDVGV